MKPFMKKLTLLFCLLSLALSAQQQAEINQEEVTRLITELASDKMEGRAIFTPGIELSSAFIENEFNNIGLSHFQKSANYRQEFIAKKKPANNVIGYLPGKSLPDEYVIFSAHYDHLGVGKRGNDTVYNGANDDASGVTAVIALAKYFAARNENERSIIFVLFTGEEVGGFGSKYFTEQVDAKNIVAMFNIEMIGTESKWGNNSAYITGFEKSNFGSILQENLKGSDFNFNPDPYPSQQLFYRSDNARLAALGVPAHTISTSKMDSEANYHQLSDEVGTLDLINMTEIIKSIAISSQSIISGKDTPTRINK
jgi:Zn-dependent M28 family amino/carboxypeptidase